VSGLALVIDHGSGVSTVYFHSETLLVGKGDHVAPGQVVSRSGNTGRSTDHACISSSICPPGPSTRSASARPDRVWISEEEIFDTFPLFACAHCSR
jgi:hypothetical protein